MNADLQPIWQNEVVLRLIGSFSGAVFAFAAAYGLYRIQECRRKRNEIQKENETRNRLKKELRRGLLAEMDEVRIRLACTVYPLAESLGTLDREFLNWLYGHFSGYKGTYPIGDIPQSIEKLLKQTDQQLSASAAFLAQQKEAVGFRLKTYHLPFLDSATGQLSLFDIHFQASIFEIRSRLHILNEETDTAHFYSRSTFDSTVSLNNQEIIRLNLRGCYKTIADMSRTAADKISNLLSQNECVNKKCRH